MLSQMQHAKGNFGGAVKSAIRPLGGLGYPSSIRRRSSGEEVAAQPGCVSGAVTSIVRLSLITGLVNRQEKRPPWRKLHVDSPPRIRPLFVFSRLKQRSRNRSEHYAF